MNFGVSGEMIFLFLLVLVLFGPKKMPEIGRQIARLLNEFRRASNEFRSQIESEVNSLDPSNGRQSYGSSRQQILPSLQAPLGSLANRIFNPPPPEKLQAVEEAAAEDAAVKAASAESVARKTAEPLAKAAETPGEPAASKVAPDA
ncbi:MAG: twin-arginine translocase TatA/TatE family subunit [Terriglobales bacterium]|jgi:sec-independent protein translocase protein TatB